MSCAMDNLLADIEAFCTRHEMSESAFGLAALRDKPFVMQLRSGRRVWPETEAKVRSFMAGYSATQGRAA